MRETVVIAVGVHVEFQTDVPDLVFAGECDRGRAGLAQGGKQKRGENRDYDDHNQKLDQREQAVP